MLISGLGNAEVFENGEQTGSPAAAIWQLQHPNSRNPTYLMNATLELSNNLKMCVPKGLLQKRTPHGYPTFAANLTPRYTVVDLHLDQSRDGLIQCVGKSKKVVLMWPATTYNMKIMLDHSNHQMKFNRVGHLLQGGIITIVGSSVGLVMYTGTIHMTITLEAGILVGINWVASECSRVAARCFRYEICAHLENDISSVLAIYGDQLEASLNGWNEVRRREVLEDWITIHPLLVTAFKSMTKKGVNELQRVCQTIEASLQGHQAPGLSCCGCTPAEYGRHFQEYHMKDLRLLIQAGEKGGRKQRGG